MPYLQILPLVAILLFFLLAPVVLIGVVSFWDYSEFDLIPDFVWTNYEELSSHALLGPFTSRRLSLRR